MHARMVSCCAAIVLAVGSVAVVSETPRFAGVAGPPAAAGEGVARRLSYAEGQLRLAIQRGDNARVRRLVEEGASITAGAADVDSPLTLAFHTGDQGMLELVVSLGGAADLSVNTWNAGARAAVLHSDLEAGRLRAWLPLRPAGADLEPVMALAAGLGREAALRVLLETGADPLSLVAVHEDEGPRETRLLTPARAISLSSHPALGPGAAWRPLLPAYADAALRGHDAAAELGISRLMALAFRGDTNAVAELLESDGAAANAADAAGWTALHWAAAGSADAALVRQLLHAGAPPEAAAASGELPLTIAAASGNAGAARAMLGAGASSLAPDFARGEFPLLFACRFGNEEVAQALIGATDELEPGLRRAALSMAAYEAASFGHWTLVLALLKAGADATFKGGPASTTSILAVVAGAPAGGGEIVDALFAAGVDEPSEGATGAWWAMERAIRSGNAEVFGRLLARIQDRGDRAVYATGQRMIDDALCRAASYRRAAVARELIDAGADVNAAGVDGATPLYYASGSGSAEMVKLLLDRGADPNAAGREGNPPLTAAASAGTGEIVGMLLAAGAKIDAANPRGYTPLQTAASFANVEAIGSLMRAGAAPAPHGHARTPIVRLAIGAHAGASEAVRALVEGGADVNGIDLAGVTPLDVAELLGDAELVRTLLDLGARRGTMQPIDVPPPPIDN